MTEAYIGLGANLGDRFHNLHQAVHLLDATPQVQVVRQSLVYETQPVGDVPQDDYLNQVVVVETELNPQALLQRLHDIEATLHRQRIVRWGPRSVDLDLLVYGDVHMQSPELTLPHPELANRRFVLVPMLEVIDNQHATWIAELLMHTLDHNWVRPYSQEKEEL